MAQCRITPQEFIKDTFTPQIGVLCSEGAEAICSKNNLSFIELLQPFCKLNSEVHYKDSSGANVSLKNLKISLIDVNAKPPPTSIARRFLNSSVSDAPLPRNQMFKVGDYTLDIPSSAPWFEAWRETFLQVQYPADHEFTKHLLAVILVISSSDNNPVDTMVQLVQSLNQMQNTSINKLPKWFNTNVMRYYVIIHETIGTENIRVNEILDAMKVSYGALNCFLLRSNSRVPNLMGEQLPDPWSQFISTRIQTTDNLKITPESSPTAGRVSLSQSLELGQEVSEGGNTLTYHPLSPENDELAKFDASSIKEAEEKKQDSPVLHGGCLSTEDVEQIKLLIHDFCTRALVPYIERQIHSLSDFIANKKGVSKSLFSATKRWFTPSKPNSSNATINTLTYPADAPELQIRRLGDLYFMFGHYSMAFQAYHTAKRDFLADRAWLYYAGALEMAALSAFMAGETTKKTFDYMEWSINTYLYTCKMAQFATRASLLSCECLKGHNLYGEAADQLIRMTSEESDLRSALLLEQASYCFLLCSRPAMVRKYAFHMVLAGHRFTKAAQRKHSLRCYKQAYQIYQAKGWNLAEDHIHYTIGRQANNLNELEEAVQSYAMLLTGESKQSPQQQTIFLKEYLTIHNSYLQQQNSLLPQVLPLPLVRNETIKVLVGPTAPLRTPGKVPAIGVSLSFEEDLQLLQKWNKLEEMLVQEAQGGLPMIFKPLVTLFTNENISNVNPIAIIGEPIQISVQLYNPLQILLNLKDIYLLWQYKDNNNRFAVNEIMEHNLDHIMKTHYIKSVTIQENSTQEVILMITPLAVGEVTIKGICYSLVSSNNSENEIALRGKQVFNIKGPKLKKKELLNDYKPDRRLEIKIVPSAPCLQVSFCEFNSELLRNELQEISVELRNTGSVPLHNIYMATSVPQLLSSCDFKQDIDENVDSAQLESSAVREKEARKNHVSYLPLPNKILEPGQFYNVLIWMKAPEIIGSATIDLLIYYENVDSTSIPRYRLVRHMWQLSIQESIKVEVSAQQSCNSKTVEELALTVKATNLNKIHHVVLTKISLLKAALLSPNWKLSSELVAPDNIKLESQESAYIFLKVVRKSSGVNNYSEVALTPDDDSRQISNTAYLDFAKRNEQSHVNIFDTSEALEKPSKKHDATLILLWRACVADSLGKTRVVYGQNQVPVDITTHDENLIEDSQLLNVTFDRISDDSKTILAETELLLNDKQITYNLAYQPIVEHDFKINRICIIPITLVIHSISEFPLIIKINTLNQTSSSSQLLSKPSRFYPYSSKHFRWTKIGCTLKTIEPLSSVTVNLSVAVLKPGTYDLGSRIEIWCNLPDYPESAVLQSYRVQSSLIITNSNSFYPLRQKPES